MAKLNIELLKLSKHQKKVKIKKIFGYVGIALSVIAGLIFVVLAIYGLVTLPYKISKV